MRTQYTLVLLFLLLFLTACPNPDNEGDPIEPEEKEKPQPPKSKKVGIAVDEAYDLGNTYVTSLLDSVAMENAEPALYIPTEHASQAYFFEKGTDKVLAVVRTNPQGDKLEINTKTITEGLYDLLPAYHELTPELKQQFETEVASTGAYKALAALVDERLKNKKSVYEADEAYALALRELNTLILSSYLSVSSEGGKILGPNPKDIKRWLLPYEACAIENQLYSYVDVIFTSIDGKDSHDFLLEPRSFLPFSDNTQTLAGENNNYYAVQLTQYSERARKENLGAATSKMIAMAVGLLMGNGTSGCTMEINQALTSELAELWAAGKMNTSPEKDLSNLIDITINVLQTSLTKEECLKALVLKGVSYKLNFWLTLWQLGWTASDMVQIQNFRNAISEPLDMTANIQLYKGLLIFGDVEFFRVDFPKPQYLTNETVEVGVEAIGMLGDYDKAKYRVVWKVQPEHGTVPIGAGTIDNSGKMMNQWTMPDKAKDEVILTAEIKDAEGDHLLGSPLIFKTEVTCEDPISMQFLGLNNITVTEDSEKTVKSYSMDFKFSDPCNMIGKAEQAVLRVVWTNDSDYKPYPGEVNLKGFAGQSEFDLSLGGSVWWFYNPDTDKHCCYTRYTYELLIDGVSYGQAAAVSPGP